MNDTLQTQLDPVSARRMLIWLSFECPSGGNPEYCPAHDIRLKSLEERRAWIDSLGDEECLAFYGRHRECEVRHSLEAKAVRKEKLRAAVG